MKKLLLSCLLACLAYFSYGQCIENLSIQTLYQNPTCGENNNELIANWTKKDGISYDIKWYKGIDVTGNIISETNLLNVTEGGIYTFEISDKNNPSCKSTFSSKEIIFYPKPSSFTIIAPKLLCSADSALFIVSPSSPNSIYNWTFNGNVTDVSNHTTAGDSVYLKFKKNSPYDMNAGSLIVKQTDLTTGCTTLDQDAVSFHFNITSTPSKLDSITFTGSKYICDGSTINFTAHGGKAQYNYIWDTDYKATTSLLNSTDYINTVPTKLLLQTQIDTLTNIKVAQNNNGCVGDSLAVDFTIQPNPEKVTFEIEDSLCVETQAIIKVIRKDTTSVLSWKIRNFTLPNYTSNELIYFFTDKVKFTVTEVNKFGCTTSSQKTIFVKECIISSNEEIKNNKILISPNPFENNTTISINTPSNITLYDVNGHVINTWNNQSTITVGEQLSQGIYFISIQNEKGIFHEKIIKQ